MRKTIFGLLVTALLLSACTAGQPVAMAPTAAPTLIPTVTPTTVPTPETPVEQPPLPALPSQGKPGLPCGNGVCEGPENAQNCPQDCAAPSLATEAPTQSADSSAILTFGIMVHLEGWNDDLDQARFDRHAKLMREYASLFETYGAKLTWESREVTDGVLKWGDNVLLEMQQRRHGVGVHADIGGEKSYDCSRFANDLRAEREQLESLGVTVRHVSGIVSHCDWVTAAAEAGYLFTTGNVAYSVMSMPPERRPPEYRNCRTPAACHDVFPAELEARLHPWRTNSGTDWLTNDPNGKLVILPSSDGLCLTKNAEQTCDEFFRELEQAIALSQPGQVNTYYVSWSLGEVINIRAFKAWLQRLDAYVQAGRVKWMTLPEMYDVYVQWEQSQ